MSAGNSLSLTNEILYNLMFCFVELSYCICHYVMLFCIYVNLFNYDYVRYTCYSIFYNVILYYVVNWSLSVIFNKINTFFFKCLENRY